MNFFQSDQYSESLKKFEETLTLLDSNKLSKSNVFEHRITDEINTIFANPSRFLLPSENLWQKYSVAISSLGKVYKYCVEHVHEEIFSLLVSLKRTLPTPCETIKIEIKDQGRLGTLQDENMITKVDTDKSFNLDSYFRKLANKVFLDSNTLGLLNYLQISENLNLLTGEDTYSNPLAIEKIEFELEKIINFSLNELETSELIKLNDDFQNAKPVNEMLLESESSEGVTVDNNCDDIVEEDSQSFSQLAENIQLFDDYNYIKQAENPKKKIVKEHLIKKNKEKVQNFSLNEQNIKFELFFADNMISSATLAKWKKEPNEMKLIPQFDKKEFFRLDSRKLTILNKTVIKESIVGVLPLEEEVRVEKNNVKEDLSSKNFMNIREIKKVLVDFIKNSSEKQIEVNKLKESTVQHIHSSLFFVALLHVCNDYCLSLATINDFLHLIMN